VEIPQENLAHQSSNLKSDSLGLFLYDKCTLGGAAGNVVTYYRAREGGFCVVFFL